MIDRVIKVTALLLASYFYWQFVCEVTGAREPWDADDFGFTWYPISLGLSALAGFFFGKKGWAAGVIVTFAQLPVMLFNIGAGPLILVGLFFLCALAVPASMVSMLAGEFARHRRVS